MPSEPIDAERYLSQPDRGADHQTTPEPIAIIGIGCRFPGADDPEAFWKLLCDGVDAVGEMPADRFDVGALYDPRPGMPGRMTTRWGGFLPGIDLFDAAFFNMSPREAERLDPQQRLLLETAWEALEAAGQVRERLVGSQTGVFVGMWLNEYEARMFRDPSRIDFYMTTGSGRYSASGRLSHVFGFSGPSFTLDCACSSSLVAVHLACQSLRTGESNLALAGGANVILEPSISIAYSQSRMMAPDGRCKFGDARANGYVRSDGAAVVVLKRLSDALRDNDPVEALILGSAVNNDGQTSGSFGTPGWAGQEDLLQKAYCNAGVNPADVHYVEAHGTGTRAGDPVEIQALASVLGAGRPSDRLLLVGSVKTNIGHTEGAAGLAGLIKTVLALKHGSIPRNLHLATPNPDIPWGKLPILIPKEHFPLSPGNGPALAGVSSFGISGTNAHVVLQEAPPGEVVAVADPSRRARLLPLSAHSPEALKALARAYRDFLSSDGEEPSLDDVCYTAGVRRTHHEHRLAVVGEDAAEMVERLEAYLRDEARPGLASDRRDPDQSGRVVFVFPGQGSQWLGMGRQLRERERVFRESLEACDAAVRIEAGWSVVEELAADETHSRLDQIDVIQPTLFAIQVSLAALWRSWGIDPDAVVGHSMGEVAAAHVAGALSLEDAVRVICRRSRLLRRTRGQGAMAVVELSMEQAQEVLAGYEDRLSVAVSNSSRSTVLSGDPAALDELIAALERREVFCRRVKVDVASHSPQMDPLRADLLAALEGVSPRAGAVPFFSTVEARVVDGTDLRAEYWVRNLRQPVLFSTTVQPLVETGHDAFVEISPHPILLPALQQELQRLGREAVVVPSLKREEPEQAMLLESLGGLYARGHSIEWTTLHPNGARVVDLPSYRWQRERYWYEGVPWTGTLPAPGSASPKAEPPCPTVAEDNTLFEVAWVEAPPPAPCAGPGRGSWLVLADRRGVGPELAERLATQGAEVVRVEAEAGLDATGGWQRLAREGWGDGWSRWSGIICLWSLDAPEFASDPESSLTDVSERDGIGLIALVGVLAGLEAARAPRLYLVTAGAQAVTDLSEVTSPAAALLWGLGRVVDAEHPRLRCTNIDLPGSPDPGAAETLAAEVTADGPDNQVAFRKGRRYVPRLVTHAAAREAEALHRPHWRSPRRGEAGPYRAVVRQAGSVGALAFETLRRSPPAPGKVEIEVVASGLNFMNALSVLGACPGHPRGVGPLGGDCAGRVASVGDGVENLRPGDAVMAVALDSLASHAVTDARLVTPIPGGLDFEQAATVPIAFLTAYYALESLARLGQGETVLIHAATGGVGLAALQVARWRGAQVIASAGSLAKRDWLQSHGIDTVVDSRSLAFADAVLAASGGRGVDVVLNSLAGEFVERGLSVLAPGGRFLELGKRDIHEGRGLSLGAFRNGLTFFAVDLDRLIRERPDMIGPLLGEVRTLLERGVFRPLPHEAFPVSRAAEAIRKLAEARHVGKLVVCVDDAQAPVESPGLDRDRLREGTGLISGGLGALGLLTARWLVETGLRHVVLVSRRAPGDRARADIEALEAAGAVVRVVSADISDRAGVEEVLRLIERELPPLCGIVHAAGILDDATLATMTPEQFRRVLAGKAVGALHLHELTADRPLAFFVLYSSIAPLIGSPGQANYAAANAFLDSLAAYRRARGLAATSIGWGPWADTGLAAADEKRGARLADRGLPSLGATSGIGLLERILADAPVQAVAAHVDWARFRQASPEVARWPFFADVMRAEDGIAAARESIRDVVLRARPGRERVASLEEHVRGLVARVLRQPAGRIDMAKPFRALGLDSLMGLELRVQLERSFEIAVPATLVWNYPNVSALARELGRRAEIPIDDEPAIQPIEPQPLEGATPDAAGGLEALLAQIEHLSDEDARRLLAENVEKRA